MPTARLRRLARRYAAACMLLLLCAGCGVAPDQRLVLGTTHTVEDSGLLDTLAALYRTQESAMRLAIVVAGSGEVLALARRGDVDVVLSHSPDDELALLRDGRAESREPVMHNDFVLLGAADDPAGVRGAGSAEEAFRRIHRAGAVFLSRGDGSGTHRRELALWEGAGIRPRGGHYLEAGAGMADALRVASQRRAYTLSDRATYEMLRGELRLQIVFEDPSALRNAYSVLVVRDAENLEAARRFADWIRSPAAQQAIGRFGRERSGRTLFVPHAR